MGSDARVSGGYTGGGRCGEGVRPGVGDVANNWLDHGAEGNRTPDPLLAKQVLSQLSYRPVAHLNMSRRAG
jgi:hypothetical protein